ncbi:amidohydrolase [Saccharobesus litoralis]|uniref:Amidohydrolase n=1 Tax=Saccharobesus litoralis TaxID=2172099 RepID=A0A2S0VUE6_9ALTE|nr:amidohydrolase family protein [Saccharobesus litoralis]AWB67841.1 amidohydrolase [Saccharobesus litoralis]
MRIDSHQHFWQYSKAEYGWISEELSILQRDFLPEDLAQELASNQLDACIAVQARQTQQETNWLLSLADEYPQIKGVVGWIDLRSAQLPQLLAQYKNSRKLVGFRHVLQDEVDPNFMLADDFIQGIKTLAESGYSYDILIFAHQLPQTLKLVESLPEMRLVVDHIAKPKIATGEDFSAWQANIEQLAQHQHIYCKVSGMVTEADFNNWQTEDFIPYLKVIFNAFGADRVMFGSDWPVCLLGGSYQQIKNIVDEFVKKEYPEDYDKVFGLNAARFYQV